MLKILFAAVVIWALLTSGYRVGDVANVIAGWVIERVEERVVPRAPVPQPARGGGVAVFAVRSGGR